MENIPIPDAPAWFESVKWLFAAFLLACAVVGPYIMGPLLNKLKKNTLPPPGEQMVSRTTMAVVGGALADTDSLNELTQAINRLAHVFEKRLLIEEEEDEQQRLDRLVNERIHRAMEKLKVKD